MCIRIVDNLTFDCRWWADRHHGNGDECHTGLNLYVVGSVLLVACQVPHNLSDTSMSHLSNFYLGQQVALLALSVLFIEKERFLMFSKEETVGLTSFEDTTI